MAWQRKRNRELKQQNDDYLWLQRCRAEEIKARKFRNHMRGMLFLFKGKPSTSPFCPWVNDPSSIRGTSSPFGSHHPNPRRYP